jgi:hypothetical protein
MRVDGSDHMSISLLPPVFKLAHMRTLPFVPIRPLPAPTPQRLPSGLRATPARR